MKVESVFQFTDKDPVDIKEMLAGETARKQKRMSLMRQFLWWAYAKESKRWTEANNEERIIISRHFYHGRIMVGVAAVTTGVFYKLFLQGIYNFRAKEILNMRTVPFALKFGISALVGGLMARDMHLKSIYEPELYKIALKYRTFYDADFK